LVTSNCLKSCNKTCVPSLAMTEFHSSLTGNSNNGTYQV
jgi:hypothetical protein